MANPDHLKMLQQGVDAWNAWIQPKGAREPREADLSGADLRAADLSGVNLSQANLQKVNLRGAKTSSERTSL